MRRFFLPLIILCVYCSTAIAVEHHTESWNTAQVIGSFTPDHKFRYYLQPQVAFIDRENKFRSAFVFVGAGYQFTPDLVCWLMDGQSEIKQANSNVQHINTIRQQLDWHTWQTNPQNFTQTAFSNITRLEERKESVSSQWQVRVREKVIFRTPWLKWQDHSFVSFDEMFLNLNKPSWVNSNNFLQQNQFFVGVGTVFKHFAFDVGYLNQYEWNYTRQMNNVMYLIFYLNLDQAFLNSSQDKSLQNFGKLVPRMNTG